MLLGSEVGPATHKWVVLSKNPNIETMGDLCPGWPCGDTGAPQLFWASLFLACDSTVKSNQRPCTLLFTQWYLHSQQDPGVSALYTDPSILRG